MLYVPLSTEPEKQILSEIYPTHLPSDPKHQHGMLGATWPHPISLWHQHISMSDINNHMLQDELNSSPFTVTHTRHTVLRDKLDPSHLLHPTCFIPPLSYLSLLHSRAKDPTSVQTHAVQLQKCIQWRVWMTGMSELEWDKNRSQEPAGGSIGQMLRFTFCRESCQGGDNIHQ